MMIRHPALRVILSVAVVLHILRRSKDLARYLEEASSLQVIQTTTIIELDSLSQKNEVVTTFNTTTTTYKYWYPLPYQDWLDDGIDASLAIRPKWGAHRPNEQNVVMALATGYELPQIIYFVTSLLETGFVGDIVLGMGTEISNETQEFLIYYAAHHHVVVYQVALLDCASIGKYGPFCVTTMFQAQTNGTTKILSDRRRPRCAAQIRYEYYWAWTTMYASEARILVSDIRDVYFQTNPFAHLPASSMETVLHVYRDTVTIGSNQPESNWIQGIYGATVLNQIKDQPGLCSGTTLGGKPAMEMYHRAMIHENDNYGSRKSCGMDQGRHIGLVRLNKLVGAPNISKVVEYDMGKGEVFTLGIPFRTWHVDVEHWKHYHVPTQEIRNDDGSPTPVVHMFDRNPILKEMIANRTRHALWNWSQTKKNSGAIGM